MATTETTATIKTLAEVEREAIEDAMRQHGGNKTRAARALGIALRTLQRKWLALQATSYASPRAAKPHEPRR